MRQNKRVWSAVFIMLCVVLGGCAASPSQTDRPSSPAAATGLSAAPSRAEGTTSTTEPASVSSSAPVTETTSSAAFAPGALLPPVDKISSVSLVKRLCGSYILHRGGPNDKPHESTLIEINYVDGHLVVEMEEQMDGETYTAAVWELIPDNPNDLLSRSLESFTVRVLPFSGFAKAGEYQDPWNATVTLTDQGVEFVLDDALTFFYERDVTLPAVHSRFPDELEEMLGEWDYAEHNPEILGSWRAQDGEQQLYFAFDDDGSCLFTVKQKERPIAMYRGAYRVTDEKTVRAVLERIGYAAMPHDLDMIFECGSDRLEIRSADAPFALSESVELARVTARHILPSRYVLPLSASAIDPIPQQLLGKWKLRFFYNSANPVPAADAGMRSTLRVIGSDPMEFLADYGLEDMKNGAKFDHKQLQLEYSDRALYEGCPNMEWSYRLHVPEAGVFYYLTLLDSETLRLMRMEPGSQRELEYFTYERVRVQP